VKTAAVRRDGRTAIAGRVDRSHEEGEGSVTTGAKHVGGALSLRLRHSDAAQRLQASAGRIAVLVWKDLLLERRRREFLGAVGLFSVLVLVVFAFALDLASEHAAAVAPGALWVAFTFAGTIGFGRSFALEREWGTLDSLLVAPVERAELYLGRVLSNTLFLLAVEAATLVAFLLFFNLPVLRLALVPVLLLGTLGLASAGTMFAAMAANMQAREILLPVLLFPILVPVLIASVKATAGVIEGTGTGPWLAILLCFDAMFITVGPWVFGAVMEE
jgi:heme exporter protein B